MTDAEMKIISIYRDENGRYRPIPRSKEDQESIDKYIAIKKKLENEINNLYNLTPTIAKFKEMQKELHKKEQQ